MRCAAVVLLAFVVPLGAEEPVPKPVPADHVARVKRGLAVFEKSVRSALVENCLECHGGKAVKGEFDLSSREALMASGYVDETAADSHLMQLVRHEAEPHMPFKAPRLPDATIAAIAEWIDLGAPYDKPLVEAANPAELAISDADRDFWSFRPLADVEPPAFENSPHVRNEIDRFLLADLDEADLVPNGPADRRTLIRRVTYDLIGLPPTPEEVAAFLADPADDATAYATVVDRLLASPHFGERWARHWMDVARFAESHGYEQDYDRPHAYHYRDFLIEAFNHDQPYDEFVRWQLAGDELDPDDAEAWKATGFLVAGAFPTQLTETEFESARYDELDDMLGTTGTAFLGLTIGCARCHDHKFDPIPNRDYFRLLATFATTIRSEVELPLEPGSALTPVSAADDLADGTGGLEIRPTDDAKEPAETTGTIKAQVAGEGVPKVKHHADERGFPHFYPEVHYLLRGDAKQKDGVATQGFLRVLSPNAEPEAWQVDPPDVEPLVDHEPSQRRSALANWITDTENGAGELLARVIVNRLWHHHFGRGIVGTPSDFGRQGDRPTHPELLDWLARDLIDHGWRLKRTHRLFVTSAAYQRSGDFHERSARIDPDNRLLWRREPRRLEAEAIRDGMLAVSGLLDTTMFGPGTLDPEHRRRSIYFFVKRSQLIPTMMLFDWPEHLVGIGRRGTTTIAPQALAFLNGPQSRRYAEGLADRLPGESLDERVVAAYELALARAPSDRERSLAAAFVEGQGRRYASEGAAEAERLALVDFCQSLLASNEFVYVD